MRRTLTLLGLVSVVIGVQFGTGAGLPKAGAATLYPSGCKAVRRTVEGGYYDMGTFYMSGQTLSVSAQWCFADDQITRHAVWYSTNIPTADRDYFTKDVTLSANGSAVGISITGTFEVPIGAGGLRQVIANNPSGEVAVEGKVSATGGYTFVNESGAGG